MLVALLLIGCKSDSEKARFILNEAHTLMGQQKPEEAKRKLDVLVAKFGHTKEATEANQMLTTLKIGEDLAKANTDETWKNTILTALATFMLDVGRFPTEQEGLKVLVEGKAIPKWNGPYWQPDNAAVLAGMARLWTQTTLCGKAPAGAPGSRCG